MARVMREELCTMIRVRGNIGVLVALAGLLVACAGGSSQWQRKRLWVTFFAPHGNRIPAIGASAIWIAHQRQLWRFAQASLYGTPYDIGLALDSDDDIRPVGEWPLLRAVALKLQLSHVW